MKRLGADVATMKQQFDEWMQSDQELKNEGEFYKVSVLGGIATVVVFCW